MAQPLATAAVRAVTVEPRRVQVVMAVAVPPVAREGTRGAPVVVEKEAVLEAQAVRPEAPGPGDPAA